MERGDLDMPAMARAIFDLMGPQSASEAAVAWLLTPPSETLCLRPDAIRNSFGWVLTHSFDQLGPAQRAAHQISEKIFLVPDVVLRNEQCVLGSALSLFSPEFYEQLPPELKPAEDDILQNQAGQYHSTLGHFVACLKTGRLWHFQKTSTGDTNVFVMRLNGAGIVLGTAHVISRSGEMLVSVSACPVCPYCEAQTGYADTAQCTCPESMRLRMFGPTDLHPMRSWDHLLAMRHSEPRDFSSRILYNRGLQTNRWPTRESVFSVNDSDPTAEELRCSYLHHLTSLTLSVLRNPTAEPKSSHASRMLLPPPSEPPDDAERALVTPETPAHSTESNQLDLEFNKITESLVDWSLLDNAETDMDLENWLEQATGSVDPADDPGTVTSSLGEGSLLKTRAPTLDPSPMGSRATSSEAVSKEELQQHDASKPGRRGRTVAASLICDQCSPPQRFSKASNLKRHVLATHQQKKMFVCDVCHCAFSQMGNLKRHYASVHLKEKPFTCETCGKTYAAQASLLRHQTSKHNLNRGAAGSEPTSVSG